MFSKTLRSKDLELNPGPSLHEVCELRQGSYVPAFLKYWNRNIFFTEKLQNINNLKKDGKCLSH